MGFFSQKRLRRKLGPKLIYSPFIRLVLFNVWFQIGFGAMVLAGVFVALYLPKIWVASPEGFLPVVKVSGLDKTQNWALKRSAKKWMAAGQHDRAAKSWEAAVAQNPADLASLRGYLENARYLDQADKHIQQVAISQMAWLLRLSHTNLADLQLAAQVCDKFKWHDVALYFLSPHPDQLPAETQAIYLKSLFHQGRIIDFQTALAKTGEKLNDPDLPLYQLALQAGWDHGGEAATAEQELERRSADGSDLATRLHMLACGQKGNVTGYERSLRRLELRNQDHAADHATYWTLLAAAGRKEEALKLAQSFTRRPESAMETLRLAGAYLRLDLTEAAHQVFKNFARDFGHSPELWLAYAGLLERTARWEELRGIARQIREIPSARDTLWGFAHYLEGRAELAENRKANAERAFAKAAESVYEIPSLAVTVARGLHKLEYSKFALQIFGETSAARENDRAYWESVFEAAFDIQDAAMVLKASERCYQLDPADPQNQNRYAAALMANRIKPEQAIELTFGLVTRFPHSTSARINHAFALLMNHRTAEARVLLDEITPATLSPLETSAYHLALFEVYHNLAMWDQAAAASEKVAVAALFPAQRQWFEEKRKQMPPRQLARVL